MDEGGIKNKSNLIISVTGAIINLILIIVFNIIYDKLAEREYERDSQNPDRV